MSEVLAGPVRRPVGRARSGRTTPAKWEPAGPRTRRVSQPRRRGHRALVQAADLNRDSGSTTNRAHRTDAGACSTTAAQPGGGGPESDRQSQLLRIDPEVTNLLVAVDDEAQTVPGINARMTGSLPAAQFDQRPSPPTRDEAAMPRYGPARILLGKKNDRLAQVSTLVTLVGMAARALLADAGFARHSTPNTEANWRGVPFGTMQEPPQPAAARDGCTSPIAEREQCHLALRKAPGLPKDVWARGSEPSSRWRTVRAALANGDASRVLDGRVTLGTQWSAADRHRDGRSRFAYSLRDVRDAEPTRRPDVAPSLRAHSRSVALGRERCPAPRPTTRAG